MKKKPILHNTIITVCSILPVLLGAIGIVITDSGDNTPDYVKVVKGVPTSGYLSAKAEKFLKEGGLTGNIEYLLDEQEVNGLWATLVPSIHIPMTNLYSLYVDIDEKDNILASPSCRLPSLPELSRPGMSNLSSIRTDLPVSSSVSRCSIRNRKG